MAMTVADDSSSDDALAVNASPLAIVESNLARERVLACHPTAHSGVLPFVTNDAPPPREMIRLLAEEMNSLSVKERNDILEDVHGVGDIPTEDPIFIEERLREMDMRILDAIEAGRMETYKMALKQNPEYVSNRVFRLMFLRSELYNPGAVPDRLETHLSNKVRLFGETKLTKDIELDDLDQADLYTLHAGYIYRPDVRDHLGRSIVILRMPFLRYCGVENLERVHWYLAMLALDETTQIRGCIYIAEKDGINSDYGLAYAKATALLHYAIPCHIAACHLVIFNPEDAPATKVMPYFLARPHRLRYRGHIVSNHNQMLEIFRTYGIRLMSFQLPSRSENSIATSSNLMQLQFHIRSIRVRKMVLLRQEAERKSVIKADETKSRGQIDSYEFLDDSSNEFSDNHEDGEEEYADENGEILSKRKFIEPDFSGGSIERNRMGELDKIRVLSMFLSSSNHEVEAPHVIRRPPRETSIGEGVTPRQEDVLLGHGMCRNHPGTIYLRDLVASRSSEYRGAGRFRKGDIFARL